MILTFYFVFVVLLSSNVYSQTCRPSGQNNQCSTNKDCGCLSLVSSENSGVCGFLGTSCSQLDLCRNSDNSCKRSDYVCVRHPECENTPVCYPLSMIDQRICPPLQAMNSTIATTVITPTTSTSSIPNDGICEKASWNRQGVTIAGGLSWGNGLNQLNSPMGIFIDASRSIYIADTNNARIVQWTQGATYGKIVAGGYGSGSGTAQLYGPMDLVVDSAGTLYITDTLNNRIQKWNRTGQVGETILIVQRPIGIALDEEESLYVSATYWSKDLIKLRKGDKQGSIIATNLPDLYHLFVSRNRSIYAADMNNGRIWKVEHEKSQISVVIGQLQNLGVSQLSFPYSVAVDQSGVIYVVEYGAHRITRWLPDHNAGIVIAGGRGQGFQSDQLNLPTDIGFDPDGNLYVADAGNHRIQKFTINRTLCQ